MTMVLPISLMKTSGRFRHARSVNVPDRKTVLICYLKQIFCLKRLSNLAYTMFQVSKDK